MEDCKQTKTLKCTCGKQVTVEMEGISCYNVSDAQKLTGGWQYIAKYDGGSSWLCVECAAKAVQLAKELVAVVGHTDFTIRRFIPMEERRDD